MSHSVPETLKWTEFVVAYGWRAYAHEIATVVGRNVDDVERVRRTGACERLEESKRFSELFSLWHGRLPEEAEWPLPRKFSGRGRYGWQPPEIALLASLVGRLGAADIARTLTSRLRLRTGDPDAERTTQAVQVRIKQIGMQSKDVIGGVTTADAGREIGSLAIIHHAIRDKRLSAVRVGRLWVIPHEAWKAWKAKRVFPPAGFVLLSSIRDELAIRSDKLSEFARMGYVPTAVRCNPYGTKGPSTQFGTWYVDKKVADNLLADRRAGRPMPWHGKPLQDNLRVTFRLWSARRHPASCKTCAEIWGENGAPRSFEEYAETYPPLAHGAKRHLTRKWDPGMTISAVAGYTGSAVNDVRRAIRSGMLAVTREHRRQYIPRTEAARWKARKCPTGGSTNSWLSLESARKHYLFTLKELRCFIACGRLNSKIGTNGPMRGVVYVSKHQCRRLREEIGFTEDEAARRVGVSVPRLRVLLEGVDWRKANGIPLATVQAAIKRLESREGYTIEAAANQVGMPSQWILDRLREGTIRISRAKWDRRRAYISKPMLTRLHEAKRTPVRQDRLSEDWLRLSEAALEAGVTGATIMRWATDGELDRRLSTRGWRYHRRAVRARARIYWRTVRYHRATPPSWLQPAARAQPVPNVPHECSKQIGLLT